MKMLFLVTRNLKSANASICRAAIHIHISHCSPNQQRAVAKRNVAEEEEACQRESVDIISAVKNSLKKKYGEGGPSQDEKMN